MTDGITAILLPHEIRELRPSAKFKNAPDLSPAFPSILQLVLGARARLNGFACYSVFGDSYFAMAASSVTYETFTHFLSLPPLPFGKWFQNPQRLARRQLTPNHFPQKSEKGSASSPSSIIIRPALRFLRFLLFICLSSVSICVHPWLCLSFFAEPAEFGTRQSSWALPPLPFSQSASLWEARQKSTTCCRSPLYVESLPRFPSKNQKREAPHSA